MFQIQKMYSYLYIYIERNKKIYTFLMYTPNDGKAEVFLVVIKDKKQKLEKYRISFFSW